MSYTFFDPSSATDLAKFQGTFAGIQAANTSTTGVAAASTSIFNQAGYYALQDTDTGNVTLQKLADDSLYTGEWYDQTTEQTFDFESSDSTFDSSSLTDNMSAADIASLDQ